MASPATPLAGWMLHRGGFATPRTGGTATRGRRTVTFKKPRTTAATQLAARTAARIARREAAEEAAAAQGLAAIRRALNTPAPQPRVVPNAPPGAPQKQPRENPSPRNMPKPQRLENNPQFKAAGYNKNIKNLKNTINKLQKNIASRNKNKNNKVDELRKRLSNSLSEIRELIKMRTNYMHSFSGIRGRPTNYYSPNTFSRYYRVPPVHRGLSQYYYYERPGVPRYVQQLPARVWHINQGGRGLPPVPFYPTRRQVRRARR